MKSLQNSSFSVKLAGDTIMLTTVFSLAVIVATFFVSNSALVFETKTAIFAGIVVAYPLLCAAFYYRQRTRAANLQSAEATSAFNEEIEDKLFALEEASEFFGASLKFSDMFRLVASRIDEIVPFAACVLYLHDETGDNILQIKYAVGENAREFMNFRSDTNKGLAVRAFFSGKSLIDESLADEKRVFPAEIVGNFRSAAAVPLVNRGENFGVLVLYGTEPAVFDEASKTLLTAVGARVAPLFANSCAFERNLSNALTDALTNLPNERGFYLVLENQLAESIRRRDERPLTVMAMDVANFADINRRHGHAAGDRMLAFAAATIKKQLRQMDVLTRSAGDEFLAILPTANEKISFEVTERIRRAFVSTPFQISEREYVNLTINFGTATCWRDGETANQLLKTALFRKTQDKSAEKGKVIWFPKEFVN
ncbi:MAG TPA: sensor domain-containing diguanylate cyclase [Pyrinomonadaceae bacterium]|jgi:diguanylate cyclase (GGDEF)-like protein